MEWCACTWCSWWSELHHSSATWWSWHWRFDAPSCLIIWTCRTATWCIWWWFSCWRSSSRCQSGFGLGLWLQCIHGFYTKSTICLCVSTCGTNDIWTCRLVFAQFNDCFPCTHCWSSSWPSCHCASFTMSTTRSTTARGCSDPSTCARHPACLYWMPCRDRFGTSCPSLSWRSSCCSAQYKTGPSCVSFLATDQHSSTDTCGCLLWMGSQSLFGLSQWSWMAHPGACPSLHPAWRLFQSDCPTSTRWPWWYCPCCTCCAWSSGSLWFSNGQSSHSWPATGWQSGPCTCTSCGTSGWCSCTYLQERWRSGVWWLSCVGSISTTHCSSSPWRWLDQRLDVPASTTFSCAWHGRSPWRSCLPLLTDMVHSSWPTSVVPTSSTCTPYQWGNWMVPWLAANLDWPPWSSHCCDNPFGSTYAATVTTSIVLCSLDSWTSSTTWAQCCCRLGSIWVSTRQCSDAVCQVYATTCHCERCHSGKWACTSLQCSTLFCLDWSSSSECRSCDCCWIGHRDANPSSTHALWTISTGATTVPSWWDARWTISTDNPFDACRWDPFHWGWASWRHHCFSSTSCFDTSTQFEDFLSGVLRCGYPT